MRDFERALAENREKWKRFTDSDVPQHYEYSRFPLKYWFRKWVDQHPEKPYIVSKERVLTYAASNELACKLGNALLSLGVHKGDRVMVAAPPGVEYVIIFQALMKIGAIEVPANDRYTAQELFNRLVDSKASAIIAPSYVFQVLEPVLTRPDFPARNFVVYGAGDTAVFSAPNVYRMEQLIEGSDLSEPEMTIHADDPARLQYTGGTTGEYKGCVLTNFMIHVQSYLTTMWYTSGYKLIRQEDIRTLCSLPLSHIYGFNANINICLFSGGTIIFSNSNKPEDIVQAIITHKPTMFALVPKMLMDLLECPDIKKMEHSSLKGIFCGSAPLPVTAIEKFEKLTGGIIAEGYGMSEASCTIAMNPLLSLRKLGSCGIARPDTDLLIVDMETGLDIMKPGEPGEIIIRGPMVMREYWHKPHETEKTIKNGWLYTGDIGSLDKDGYLYLHDRRVDVINCSGFKVYPREVEEVLYTMPQIFKACVVGVPDPKRGKTVKAFIQTKPGQSLTFQEVVDWCKKSLSHYKLPTIVQFIDPMPVTSVGKINRRRLLEINV